MEGVVIPRGRRPKRKMRSTSVAATRKLAKSLAILKADDELKYFDQSQSLTPVPAGDVGSSFVGSIDRGTDPDQRIGRKIAVSSIRVRGTISLGSSAGPLYPYSDFRIVVFYDKATKGADPAVTDVMASASVNAHKNLQNENRFTILCDQIITGPGRTGNDDGGGHKLVDFYKAFKKPLIVEYSANEGQVSDITTGNINMLMFATDGPTTGHTFTGYSRVRFRG